MKNYDFIKNEKLLPGVYEFTISDPFLKKLKKGVQFTIKSPLKYNEIVLGEYVFCIEIDKEKTCFTPDMIKKIK